MNHGNEDKSGNGVADGIVDKGVNLHGKEELCMVNVYARRSKHYQYYIRDVHNHIIEAVLLKQIGGVEDCRPRVYSSFAMGFFGGG